MNVNKKSASSLPNKRVRRTAAAAKELILTTAAARLKDQGVEGLNLTGVAEDAGMSHATIIHHFGSREEMRRALVAHMTAALLTDVLTALQKEVPAVDLCQDLFRTIIDNGHARLLAWRAIDSSNESALPGDDIQALFSAVIKTIAGNLTTEEASTAAIGTAVQPSKADLERAQNIVMLVASTAIGLGVAGPQLSGLLDMSEAGQREFPRWLAQLVTGSADALTS